MLRKVDGALRGRRPVRQGSHLLTTAASKGGAVRPTFNDHPPTPSPDCPRTHSARAVQFVRDISTEMSSGAAALLTQALKASGSVVGLVDGFAQATQNVAGPFRCPVRPASTAEAPRAVGPCPAAIAAADGHGNIWQGRSLRACLIGRRRHTFGTARCAHCLGG